ncbi:MAG: hypothetical protein VKK04_17510 [Synechococcales bacterium]|nr:hypothetical protein [Synechococcales bacterium]
MSPASLSTTLTDIGIGIEAFLFFALLIKSNQIAVKCWAIAFGCTAIAALIGGFYHGFAGSFSQPVGSFCQATIAYFVSAASSMMLLGVVKSSASPARQLWLMGAIGLKFGVFASLYRAYPEDFSYVVADYLSAMGIVLVLSIKKYRAYQTAIAIWLSGGIAISIIAASLLAWRWWPTSATNPETIYHVVQMLALYFFFRGSRLLIDAKAV